MNLNPFELRENDYYAVDMYEENGHYPKEKKDVEILLDSYGYGYLLKGINTEVDWRVKEYCGSYLGELFCLGNIEDKIYFVNTGYGSCSGCDWYEANCGSIKGLQSVQDGLKRDIKEFDNIDSFLEWLNSDDRRTVWWDEDREQFLKEVKLKYNIFEF